MRAALPGPGVVGPAGGRPAGDGERLPHFKGVSVDERVGLQQRVHRQVVGGSDAAQRVAGLDGVAAALVELVARDVWCGRERRLVGHIGDPGFALSTCQFLVLITVILSSVSSGLRADESAMASSPPARCAGRT